MILPSLTPILKYFLISSGSALFWARKLAYNCHESLTPLSAAYFKYLLHFSKSLVNPNSGWSNPYTDPIYWAAAGIPSFKALYKYLRAILMSFSTPVPYL